MFAIVTNRVSGRVSVQFIEPNIMARCGSSPKILGDLAPGPLHVITNTMSVIKTGNLQKSGAQTQTGGGAVPGPSVEPKHTVYAVDCGRTAPAE